MHGGPCGSAQSGGDVSARREGAGPSHLTPSLTQSNALLPKAKLKGLRNLGACCSHTNTWSKDRGAVGLPVSSEW